MFPKELDALSSSAKSVAHRESPLFTGNKAGRDIVVVVAFDDGVVAFGPELLRSRERGPVPDMVQPELEDKVCCSEWAGEVLQ